jgi:hypothetical protein
MNKYNLDKLIKIEYQDVRKSVRYIYKNEIKLFGFIIRKAGYYIKGYSRYLYQESLDGHFLGLGNEVFEHPKIILYFENDYKQVRYFYTFEKCVNFVNIITSKGRWYE